MLLIPWDKRKACSPAAKRTAKHQTLGLFNDRAGVLFNSCCVHFPGLFGVPSALRHTQTAAVLGRQKWRLEGVCVMYICVQVVHPSCAGVFAHFLICIFLPLFVLC